MMSNAHKLAHLGVNCMIRRSTLSDANRRRKSAVFDDIYMAVYQYGETAKYGKNQTQFPVYITILINFTRYTTDKKPD